MKAIGLAVTALMFLSTSVFAAEKTPAVVSEYPDLSRAPDVSGLPESLQKITIVAWLMTELWPLGPYDLAFIARCFDEPFVPSEAKNPGQGKKTKRAKNAK